MTKMGKRGLVAGVTICVLTLALAAASNAALFGLLKSKSGAKAGPAVRHTLIIFPFDKDAESAAGVPEDFGQNIADYLLSTLATSKGYSVILYSERLTPVRRAKEDNFVKDQDIKGPFFADKAKSDKLADILATDYYVVGSVESYSYDKDKKTAELLLKADLINAKTGKLSQEFMVGGSAAQAAQPMDEAELQSIAAGKAADALTEKILSTSAADTKAPAKGK